MEARTASCSRSPVKAGQAASNLPCKAVTTAKCSALPPKLCATTEPQLERLFWHDIVETLSFTNFFPRNACRTQQLNQVRLECRIEL